VVPDVEETLTTSFKATQRYSPNGWTDLGQRTRPKDDLTLLIEQDREGGQILETADLLRRRRASWRR
jgi:hypothetical protein